MKLSNQRQGEFFITAEIILWSMFPIIIQLSFSSVSPFTSLAISSLFAAAFFACIMTIRNRWHELTNARAIRFAVISTFFIGVLYYLLYFLSLKFSSAGNISILALSETFFSFLLFHVWKKEFIPKEHILGATFILLGAVIVLAPNVKMLHIGDLLILIAAAIVPFGNFYVQKARKLISTETIIFVRGIVGALAIFLLSFLFHAASSLTSVFHSLPFLATNGVVIQGIAAIFWIEGIHRIPVAKANALSALGPLMTLLLAWMVFKTTPTAWQLLALVPMFFGVILISKKANKDKMVN